MSRFKYFVLAVFLSAIITSCQKQPKPQPETNSAPVIKPTAVCILDGTALWKDPLQKKEKGSWLSSLRLGETVNLLEGTIVDSTDKYKEYCQVELSDGKTGWASSYGLVKAATAGAVKEETPVYQRPDLLTITDKKFKMLDVVAVTQSKENLCEVVGEAGTVKGWIKKEAILGSKEDITVAVMANKIFRDNVKMTRAEQLEKIIASSPYPDSYFMQQFRLETLPDTVAKTEDESSGTEDTEDGGH
ncbi:hypothetical protein HZA73_01210 [candidate division TA06 bacterium]|nr:hypothetical protein [candidate division TA06 bacterium]